MSTLDAIAMEQEKSSSSIPMPTVARLTTGQVIAGIHNLGQQLNIIGTAYQSLPDATPQAVDGLLKQIVEYCGAMVKTAERLREGNK